MIKSGNNTGIEYFVIYPKNEGILIPDSSAIDFTIKLGAFPIYVIAPIKTAPEEIANKVMCNSPINAAGLPPAVLKKTR